MIIVTKVIEIPLIGHKPIVDKIHERGFTAGLWLAPFVAEKESKLFKEHQDWIKKDEAVKLAVGKK